MAVDTVREGFQTIPILATAHGNQLYASLEHTFEAKLLDRHETPGGEPAYMTIRIGDSVITVMKPLEGGQPTRSAFYVYVPDVDLVHRRAVDAGARSVQEPTDAVQGDRMATVIDPFGNQWTVASRIAAAVDEKVFARSDAVVGLQVFLSAARADGMSSAPCVTP
jgi:PhnB protein